MGERHRRLDLRLLVSLVCASPFAFGLLFFCSSPVSADGISGWGNINGISIKQYEDGKRTSAQNSLTQNYYVLMNNPVTPLLSYQVYLRTNLADQHSTGATGNRTTTYQRSAEPALDLFLRNPMYSLDTGYRRLEQWSAAHISDANRKTSEFYYSRLSITPYQFPSLMLEYDRQADYDYLTPQQTNDSSNRYTANSAYKFNIKDLDLSYGAYYMRNETKTPLSTAFKSVTDSFNGLYNMGYTKSIKDGFALVSAVYQGSYVNNRTQQFSAQTGNVSLERTPLAGLYAKGTATEASSILPHAAGDPTNINQLSSQGALIAAFNNPNQTAALSTPVANINLGQNEITADANKYHNIGIQVISSDQSVDTLYIYVTSVNLVTSDTVLGSDPTKWKVFTGTANLSLVNNWTPVTVTGVSLTVFDAPNKIYRYAITFAPQKAQFFKAINLATASVNDVFVTQIKAFGTDVISSTGRTVTSNVLFNQGVNLNVNLRPAEKLNLALNYLVNRADTNPSSVWGAAGDIAGDLVTKATKGGGPDRSGTITKTYGAAATWMAHRLLTTTARLQRNENYDNRRTLDISSNIYSLGFSSVPLPTLNTNLTLIRNDNFSFGAKQSTNDSALLNLGTKLYRDVNMTTDIGYTTSQLSGANSQSSNSRYVRGTVDSVFTPRLFTTVTYGFNWTTTGNQTAATEEGTTIVTYRPGRLINLSGTFRISDADGNTTTSEGILADWMPLPAIKLNANYQHTNSAPGPVITDSFSNYAIWHMTKFLDLQLTYGYTRNEAVKKTESYNLGFNLNAKFW